MMGCMSCGGYMGAVDPSSCDGNGGQDADGNVLNSDGTLYTGPCPQIVGPLVSQMGPAGATGATASGMLVPLIAVAILGYLFGSGRKR